MPDPRRMHGQAIPAGELPAGSVTVRVVRESVGNNVAGVAVELHGAGDVRRATTGADGRAQFASVPAGARVHATAVVDGERLESTTFDVPAAGGVRTILVAGLGLGTGGGAPRRRRQPPSAMAGSGGLSFGNNTRFAIEFQDDTIAVFYLLEIVNSSGAPVAPASPLVITLPAEAVGAALLEGASPLASVNGTRVSIAGPLPGRRDLGARCVPRGVLGRASRVRAGLPACRSIRSALGVQRLSGLTVESPQASSVREASLSGQAFFIASGPGLPAGTPLRLTLAGLPHKSPLPLYIGARAGRRGGRHRRVAGDDAGQRAATTAVGVWRRDERADWQRWRRSTPTIGPDGCPRQPTTSAEPGCSPTSNASTARSISGGVPPGGGQGLAA